MRGFDGFQRSEGQQTPGASKSAQLLILKSEKKASKHREKKKRPCFEFSSCVCILNFIQSDLKGNRSKVASSFLHQKTGKLLICQLKLKKMKRIPADGGGDFFFRFLTFFLKLWQQNVKRSLYLRFRVRSSKRRTWC